MGIRFFCPNGHKLNVKEFQAGRRGICPFCGARTQIPTQSTRPSTKLRKRRAAGQTAAQTLEHDEAEDAQASDSSPDILPGEPPHLPGDPAGGKLLGPSTAPGSIAAGPIVAPPAGSSSASRGQRTANSGAAAARPQGAPAPRSASLSAATTAPNILATASAVAAGPVLAPSPVPQSRTETSAPPLQAQVISKEPLDPIAEAPEMIWYVRPPSGGQFGPAPGELMRTWMGEGRVSADSLVWREGWRDWQEAGKVFPKLRGSQLSDVSETTPSVSTAAVPTAQAAHRPKVGHSSDRSQLALLAVLSLAVIVLVFVFIYMLVK